MCPPSNCFLSSVPTVRGLTVCRLLHCSQPRISVRSPQHWLPGADGGQADPADSLIRGPKSTKLSRAALFTRDLNKPYFWAALP